MKSSSPQFKINLFAAFLCSFLFEMSFGQSYHAINGSPYAGVTSMYVNPASTINSAYKWDVNIFSGQLGISNSLFTINDASLRQFNTAYTEFTNGLRSRYFHANMDLSVLNARFQINKKSALAFGLRGRMFVNAKTMPFAYSDSISSLQSFLHANNKIDFMQGYLTNSGWAEFNLNYSRVLQETPSSRLSGGITMSYSRGLSGADFNMLHLTYAEQATTNGNFYPIIGGSAQAAYSYNYSLLDANRSILSNTKTFVENTLSALNFNIGFEYLFRKNMPFDDETITPENYDWKIGVSIMDIGKNRYEPAGGSFNVSMPKTTAIDTTLQLQLANATTLTEVRNTLNNYFNKVDTLRSAFAIANPTRIVINVDRNLGNHFFVNGELSVNVFSTEPWMKLRTREINLLTITPRWETANFGAYLPIQYNTQGQLWIGGALKLGPLLLGVHSLDFYKWFKKGTQTLNGGFYIMLNVYPFRKKENDGIDCPKY